MKNKKYKLLKWFPTLPKDWVVGMSVLNYESNAYLYTPCEFSDYTKLALSKPVVENNPEFFEEIIEKKYEILSFENKVAGKWVNVGLNRFQYEGDLIKHLDFMLKSESNYISSIRRLSDNEVFSINDKTTKGIIRKIEICDSGNVFGIYTDLHNCWNGSQTFEKAKPVLFVTEDGKEIKTGDEYWYVVASDSAAIPWRWKALHDVANWTHETEAKKPPLGYYQFFSKAKAQEWIILNKPVLSLKDVASIYPGINKEHNTPSHQAEQLKELVKSRL